MDNKLLMLCVGLVIISLVTVPIMAEPPISRPEESFLNTVIMNEPDDPVPIEGTVNVSGWLHTTRQNTVELSRRAQSAIQHKYRRIQADLLHGEKLGPL